MALELVGGAFLEAGFAALLGKIAYPAVVAFFKKNQSSVTLLKRLKISLLSINVVLSDAEEKQITNGYVKEWMEELKGVVFDADDVMDEICTYAKISEVRVNNHDFITPFNLHDAELEQKVRDIIERLDFIIKQKDMLQLQMVKEVKIPPKVPTSSVVGSSDVYGRDDDKEALMKLLFSDDPEGECNISVIPIVGMGGIGKTTLAKLVYNDERVQREFDIKAWVYVSEKFDVIKITKTLVEEITLCSCSIEELNLLQRDLKKRLLKKKFLIILDDVWNQNYIKWETLKNPFVYGAPGSKIIVTTRIAHVASIMQTVKPYYLSELSDDDCWMLFSKHVFGYANSNAHQNLRNIGKKIIKKCKGLPLAVKTLAGLLRSKDDTKEWYKVLNSEIWDLQDDESNILPALRLSYHYLPSNAKRCFAYCSVFPKDYEYEKEKLILLWMAEGLLQQLRRHKRIEEAGDEIFSELVSRSFFQQSKRNKSCFVMHHFVNDLAQFVSGKFSVRVEGNYDEVEESARYLLHLIARKFPAAHWKTISKAIHLRTFMELRLVDKSVSFIDEVPHDLLIKLKCLRVLSLEGIYLRGLPDSVTELIHLRYLDLSGAKMNMLWESIGGLYNLETLKLVGCSNLQQLPKDFHKLVSLRYLDITRTRLKWMPLHMNALTNLQNLSDFFAGKEYGSSIGELGELSDLHGSLFIHNFEHVSFVDSGKAVLSKKEFLEKLVLEWNENGDTDNSRQEKDILERLEPHTNLKELSIYNYLGTEFPNWVGDSSFCNLLFMDLKGSKYCYKLPPLGQLGSLKELRISQFDGLVSVGSEFYGDATQSFGSLETLRIENMSSWEEWQHPNEANKAFAVLKELHINSCPRLIKDLPINLPSLTLLVIRDCKKLVSSLPTTSSALRVLNIDNCGNLKFPTRVYQFHQTLTSLYLHNSFDSLVLLPLDIFPKLKSLDVSGCKNLEAFTVSGTMRIRRPILASLRSLFISNCPKLVTFPIEGFFAPKLALLNIDYCEELKSLPLKMDLLLPGLIELQLWRCPQIQPIEKWPCDLRSVRIWNCDKLIARHLEWDQSNPLHLTDFTMSGAFTVKSEECCSTVASSTFGSGRRALSSSSQKKSFSKIVFR
ncbi:putative disease resistance RPP13-like protein 1 [Vicia villosa]|uniref:putative disease resistance RPP13-like protein 1 n=1 Tax=Vicia villosa TaxID=3911 RepID=UPI00273CA898|nr:putative disease resistance RPP13-like protein 1 [Vicia villosa]